jgi:hypothetical protein
MECCIQFGCYNCSTKEFPVVILNVSFSENGDLITPGNYLFPDLMNALYRMDCSNVTEYRKTHEKSSNRAQMFKHFDKIIKTYFFELSMILNFENCSLKDFAFFEIITKYLENVRRTISEIH